MLYKALVPMRIQERVHTNFNQAGTTTGRLSSSNPNFTKYLLFVLLLVVKFVKKRFFYTEPGWMLVADYSQIELKFFGTFDSKEPILVETIKIMGIFSHGNSAIIVV
jgi:DNA polymerase-1